MKIVMTLLVRNEEDILPAFLAYHFATGVDFIIATDNRSTDSSARILKDYERQGKLDYIYETDDNYDQARWVTRMARLAATKYHADWVINSDADEFWWPENQPSIKEALALIPDKIHIIEVKRSDFPPLPTEIQSHKPFWETMIIRENVSTNSLGMPLPPKICHRAHPDIYVYSGNHKALFNAQSKSAPQNELSIFHFPLRSLEQFTNKISLGGAALSRNQKIGPHTGGTWKKLHKLHLQGDLNSYYKEQLLSDQKISSGRASGQLIKDVRLRNQLRTLLPLSGLSK